MQELSQATELISKFGVLPILVAIIVVGGREFRRVQKECRRWQNLALSALTEADKAAGLAEFYRGAE
jgi:hypothetical protein